MSAFTNDAVVPNTTCAVSELADPNEDEVMLAGEPMSVAEVEIVSLATEVGDESSPPEVTAAEVGEDWSPADVAAAELGEDPSSTVVVAAEVGEDPSSTVVVAAEVGKDSSSTTVVAATAAEVIVSEELEPQDP